jgi:hypothetical protein
LFYQEFIINFVKIRCTQPPYLKPPEVSSSGPPGACITPSNEIIDKTIIFLIIIWCRSRIYYLKSFFKIGALNEGKK